MISSGLSVAVIGAGARSVIGLHVPDVRPGSRITAVVDTEPEGRRRAAEIFPGAQVLDSVEALIERGGVDAAVVTTPDHTHADIATALLASNIAVYLEKPLATTLDDADRVLRAAADTSTPLYVGHNFRHSGVVKTLRDVVQRGEIGEVKAVWVRHFVGNGGDYYYKDWHADRSKTNTLLLQKASHDIDVVHHLAGGYTRQVVGMGGLVMFGGITDRRERTGETMPDWFSFDNWPPASHTGLNPVVDVEDLSMMLMTLDNGVFASYQQCHFTPDYWRNYTVIGTEGRVENFGDTGGGVVRVWNRRHLHQARGDAEYEIPGVVEGHEDADRLTMAEFLEHAVTGAPTLVSPVAAREAVAAGDLAARSLRNGSVPQRVPELPDDVLTYFTSGASERSPR